ncbi:11387_t:CDS:2, partial [Funneliformis mosseae]
ALLSELESPRVCDIRLFVFDNANLNEQITRTLNEINSESR